MLGMVVYIESQQPGMGAEGSETQEHPQLHHKFEVSLGYMRIT